MESEASELPKGLLLGRDENIHLRLTGSTPLGDVGSYNRTSHWVTHLGNALTHSRLTSEFLRNPKPVSSHKQNREGVVGVQSGQYRATAESSPGRDVAEITIKEKMGLCFITHST